MEAKQGIYPLELDFRAPHGTSSIVHPESFRSNVQNAIAFARRNRPRVKRNDAFACVYLRSRAFAIAFVCEYCSQSTTCAYVRAHARTYVYIWMGQV